MKKIANYKIPPELVFGWSTKRMLFCEDTETNKSFLISWDRIVEHVQASFSWEWVQNPEDLSRNIHTRIAKISYYGVEKSYEDRHNIDMVNGKHIHYEYELGFAELQPGWVKSTWYDLIPTKKNCFVFDLDGTVVDTQTPFHAAAEADVLLKYCNVTVKPEDISARFAGIPTKQVFEELAQGCDAELLVQKKWERMYKMGMEWKINPVPYMNLLIKNLSVQGVPISIGTASPRKWIGIALRKQNYESINFTELFNEDVCVSVEDCQNPKPHPEVFLKAHDKMLSARKEIDFQTYVVGDGKADVLAGLAMNANVLYLSANPEFDGNPKVKRFEQSKELYEYVINELI